MASPLLIEINTRCRLREKSRRLGRKVILAGVTAAEIQRWRKTGFTHVWLMGVWTNGPRARKHSLESPGLRDAYDRALPGWTEEDVAGSPYAVAGYEVAPELGGTKALLAFRKKLNGAGLKLILDFVPNHVGLDHPWVTAHPERFVQADTIDVESFIGGSAEYPVRLCHGRDPYFEPWLDTAQLDLRREDTRSAVLEDLLSVAELCDGVRCDMAMLLLSEIFAETWRHHAVRGKETKGEFWPVAISTVRRRFPEFLFIAEAYWNREEELLGQGFDFAYQKTISDALLDAPHSAAEVVRQGEGWLAKGVHFLENHDERRVAALLEPDPHRAAATALLTLPGMRLLYDGQPEGETIRTPVHLGRRQEEPVNEAVKSIYDRLLQVLPQSAVGRGEARLIQAEAAWEENITHGSYLLVLWQAAPDDFDLAVINLAPHRSQCYARLKVANLATHDWQMVDRLGDERWDRNGEELQSRGLYLDTPAFATQLFHFTPASPAAAAD